MANDTLINGLSPVTAGSNGTVTNPSDVCNTTIGPAVVPIPYTNVAKSGDLSGGSSSVVINGNPVCLESSTLGTSVGNEGGDKKGISSGEINGIAEPQSSSPTVFIEGKAVVRNSDLFISNTQNTAPVPITQSQLSNSAALASAATPEKPYYQEFRFTLDTLDGEYQNELLNLEERVKLVVYNKTTQETLQSRVTVLEDGIISARHYVAEGDELEAWLLMDEDMVYENHLYEQD